MTAAEYRSLSQRDSLRRRRARWARRRGHGGRAILSATWTRARGWPEAARERDGMNRRRADRIHHRRGPRRLPLRLSLLHWRSSSAPTSSIDRGVQRPVAGARPRARSPSGCPGARGARDALRACGQREAADERRMARGGDGRHVELQQRALRLSSRCSAAADASEGSRHCTRSGWSGTLRTWKSSRPGNRGASSAMSR